jgi:hypothetical protein
LSRKIKIRNNTYWSHHSFYKRSSLRTKNSRRKQNIVIYDKHRQNSPNNSTHGQKIPQFFFECMRSRRDHHNNKRIIK